MINLPPKPFYIIQKFLNENKHVIYKYLVKKVREGVRKDLDRVELFQFHAASASNKHVAIVKQQDYITVLNDAMKSSITEEDYETAAKARDTLQLITDKSINNLLNDINSQE